MWFTILEIGFVVGAVALCVGVILLIAEVACHLRIVGRTSRRLYLVGDECNPQSYYVRPTPGIHWFGGFSPVRPCVWMSFDEATQTRERSCRYELRDGVYLTLQYAITPRIPEISNRYFSGSDDNVSPEEAFEIITLVLHQVPVLLPPAYLSQISAALSEWIESRAKYQFTCRLVIKADSVEN